MSSLWTVIRILFVRLRFIFIFAILGLIVGNWSYIMNLVDRYTRPSHAEHAVSSEFEFYCPMHPSVVRKEPGNCPICGMPLSKRKVGEKTSLPPGVVSRVQLSPFRIQQAGLATTEVVHRTMVQEVRTVGFIEWDERRIAHLSARIAGRVDELFVNFTGLRIERGDPVYKIYSPDLVTTQEEYLLALKTLESIEAQPGVKEEDQLHAKNLLESARERLRLWGISQAQVEELEKSRKASTHLIIDSPISGFVYEKDIHQGQYLQVGEDSYTIVDDSVVWMQAEVFERDIGLVKIGQLVEAKTVAYPGESFRGTVSFIQPTLQTETRTVRVRIEIPNDDHRLKAGMYVTAIFRVTVGRSSEVAYGCGPGCSAGSSDKPGSCTLCGHERVKEGGLDGEATAGSPPEFIYQCPMHPEVVSDKPGRCPKCNMELEKREKPPVQSDQVTRVVEGWRCSLHLGETSSGDSQCPDCGSAMQHVEYEQVLSVPFDSVIDTGVRKTAFVDRGGGVFEAVEITVGPRTGEYYPVLGGLKAGDRVVTAGAFLLDAEARLNPAAAAAYFGASGSPSGQAGHKH
ncbi:MAG: efflux RND transporter periplasmic adaptor subunit [Planctomycetes bacterium]|nr:efflux RND transporter periplasmic adaptor subunit [Planctomycetota bacterium]